MRRVSLLLLLLPLLVTAPGWAQERSLSLGASAGLLNGPAPEGVCSQVEALGAREARLRVDQRHFGVEVRAGWHSEVSRYGCGDVLIPRGDGVYLDDESWRLPEEGLTTELRLYSPQAGLGLRATAGGGWLWSSATPFLAGGVALRSPALLRSRVRAQLELDALTYRLRYDGVEREVRDSKTVRTTPEERAVWAPGFALRAGIEVALH